MSKAAVCAGRERHRCVSFLACVTSLALVAAALAGEDKSGTSSGAAKTADLTGLSLQELYNLDIGTLPTEPPTT